MKLSQHYQWACGSTSTNCLVGSTAILENYKIQIYPKMLKKVIHFKNFDLKLVQ